MHDFISFEDNDKFIYGFELMSMFKLIQSVRKDKKNSILRNPYNRATLSGTNLNLIKNKIILANILSDNKIIENKQDNKHKLRFRVIETFQIIDTYGHITNINWFLNLNKAQLIRFVNELKDIWNHRLTITNDLKKRIYPPHGNPFIHHHHTYIIQKNLLFIQKYIINMIYNMITKGLTSDDTALGVFYVLTALTLVSQPAAIALPWLYDSANVQN